MKPRLLSGSALTVLTTRIFRRGWIIFSARQITYLRQRDKTIPIEVENDRRILFGLVGSDVLEKIQVQNVGQEILEPIQNSKGQQLRFALASRAIDLDMIEQKIERGQPLRLATSYLTAATRELARIGIDVDQQSSIVEDGGIERLLWSQREETDAMFDLVQSGDSVASNELVIVRDNLLPVNLLLIKREGEK